MPDKFLDFDLKNLDPAQLRNAVSTTLVEGQTTSRWWSRQREGFVNGVMDNVRTGLQNGNSNAQIARSLQGTFAKHRSQANALAATATNAIANKARLETFIENDDVIKGSQQVSTLDNKTSDICIAYSGMAWKLDGKPMNSRTTLPFNGGPPRHFNCRSTLIPVLKSFEELGLPKLTGLKKGTRASLDGQLPGDITFNTFLRGKTQKFQDDLLGPARAKLWRDKKITLNQLVDMRGNPLTVDELVTLSQVRKRKRKVATAVTAAPPALTFAKPDQPEFVTGVVDDAFSESKDKSLNKAIQKAPPLQGVFVSPKKRQGAFYRSSDLNRQGAVYMWDKGGNQVRGRDYNQVFAHEYGHFLDDHIGRANKSEAGWNYGSATLNRLRSGDGRRLKGANQTKQGTASQAFLDERTKTAGTRGKSIAVKKSAKEAGLDYDLLKADFENLKVPLDQIDDNIDIMVAAVNAQDAGAVIWGSLGNLAGTLQSPAVRSLWAHTADFFGAMTKNRIGFGHSNGYYGKGRNLVHSTNTEMFANYVLMRAQFPGVAEVLRKLSPQWTKGADKLIEDFAE